MRCGGGRATSAARGRADRGDHPHQPARVVGLTSTNYAIAFVDGALSVGPAPLTVTADDKARSYGAANPALTARFDGFVLGQGPAFPGGTLALATPPPRRATSGATRSPPTLNLARLQQIGQDTTDPNLETRFYVGVIGRL